MLIWRDCRFHVFDKWVQTPLKLLGRFFLKDGNFYLPAFNVYTYNSFFQVTCIGFRDGIIAWWKLFQTSVFKMLSLWHEFLLKSICFFTVKNISFTWKGYIKSVYFFQKYLGSILLVTNYFHRNGQCIWSTLLFKTNTPRTHPELILLINSAS